MYCTGGIRCDVYSTFLRKKGFNQLYTLEGGVQNYLRKEGDSHWKGSLFVFDGRMAIPANISGTVMCYYTAYEKARRCFSSASGS